MTESDMEKIRNLKGCKVKLCESETGWKLELNDDNPACKKSLETITKKLGPHSRKYLSKRIVTEREDIKKNLKEIGLTE